MIGITEKKAMDPQQIEAIAQIILSMSAEERQLLELTLKAADLQKDVLSAESKSIQITKIAQDIGAYEEKYATPLAPLPNDQWSVANGAVANGANSNGAGKNGAQAKPASPLEPLPTDAW